MTYTVGTGVCQASDFITLVVDDVTVDITNTNIIVCDIDNNPIQLTGTPSGGTWFGNGVNSSTGVVTPSGLNAGSNTIFYSYTDPTTGCSNSDFIDITVITCAVSAGLDKTVCQNGTIQLIGSPSGGTWSGTNVTSGGFFDANNVSAGTYTLTYTSTGSSSSDNMVLTVASLPTVNAVDTSVCNNPLNFTLEGLPSGGLWTSGTGGLINSSGVFNTVIGGGLDSTHWAVYTYTDANNCTNTDTALISFVSSFQNFPDVADVFVDNASICVSADSIGLPEVFPPMGIWSGPSFISNTAGTINPSALGVGVYTYSYSFGEGTCLTSDDVIVTVNSDINLVLPYDTVEICWKSDVFAIADPAPLGGVWTGIGFGDFSDGPKFLSDSVPSPGDYSLIYTYQGGTQCERQDSIIFRVLPELFVSPNVSGMPFVTNDSLEFCVSSGADTLMSYFTVNGPSSIPTWTLLNGNVAVQDPFDGTISNQNAGAGLYNLNLKSDDFFCEINDTFFVGVRPIDPPSLVATNIEVCADRDLSLSVVEPFPPVGVTYLFKRVGNGISSNVYDDTLQIGGNNIFSVADISQFSPLIENGDQFQVVKIDANGCIGISNTIQITVNPIPVFELEVDSFVTGFNICDGKAQKIQVKPDPGAVYTLASYLWSEGNTFNLVSSNSTYSSNAFSQGDIVILEAFDANGCFFSDSISINVNPLPDITFLANDTTVCTDATVNFTASVANMTGVNYEYNRNGTTVSSVNNWTNNSFMVGDVVEVIVTNPTTSCIDSAEILMQIDTFPIVEVLFAPSSTVSEPLEDTLCQGVMINPELEASISGSNIASTVWTSPTGTVQNIQGNYRFITNSSSAGNQTVTANVTTNYGCVTSVSDDFYLKPKPKAAFSSILTTLNTTTNTDSTATIEVCSGTDLVLGFSSTGYNANTSFNWEIVNGSPNSVGIDDPGPFVGDSTMNLPAFVSSNFLTYTDYFSVYTELDGCVNQDSTLDISLIVYPTPVIQEVEDLSLCAGDSIPLLNFETQVPNQDALTWEADQLAFLQNQNGNDLLPAQATNAATSNDTTQSIEVVNIQVFGTMYGICLTDTMDFDISLASIPDTQSIFTPNGVDYCENGSVIIETLQNFTDYLWLRNGIDTVGTNYNLAVSTPGTYNVFAVNGDCRSNPSVGLTIQSVAGIPISADNSGAGLPPYYEKFESGASDWFTEQATLSPDSDWEVGLPNGVNITTNGNNSKAWITTPSGAHSDEQQSWVISPCFDFSNSNQPVLAFRLNSDMKDNVSGAVVQYWAGTTGTWETLGPDTLSQFGENWYNGNNILTSPGGQGSGWTNSTPSWQLVRYPLDELVGEDAVRFRIAFSADGNNAEFKEGFAFDDVWIGERYKPILVETFTNFDETTSNLAVYEALNSDTSVVGIQYHLIDANDPFHQSNIPDNNARAIFYNISSFGAPTTVIDGETIIETLNAADSLQWSNDTYAVHELEPAPFRISPIIQDVQGSSMTFRSSIALLDTNAILLNDPEWMAIENAIDNDKIVVRGVVIEDSVFIANTGTYVKNVMRKMIPDHGGYVYDINEDRYWFSWTDNLISTSNELDVVIMVQNVDNQEVYAVRSGTTQFVSTNNILTSDLENTMQVFPNPAHDYFDVRLDNPIAEDAIWQMYDVNGRLVESGQLPKQIQGFRYECNHLPEGVYFISIETDLYTIAPQKIVILRK